MRNPRKSVNVGRVVSVSGRKSGTASVLVLFEGLKEPTRLHWTYLDRIDRSTYEGSGHMGSGQRGLRWTSTEDRLLIELVASNASDTTLSTRLKRSSEAVRMRLLVLQKKQKQLVDELMPTPELPDKTPVDQLQLPTRIKRALLFQGLATVGDIREASDNMLLSFQDFGQGSLSYLRRHLGLPSQEGVRPALASKDSGK